MREPLTSATLSRMVRMKPLAELRSGFVLNLTLEE